MIPSKCQLYRLENAGVLYARKIVENLRLLLIAVCAAMEELEIGIDPALRSSSDKMKFSRPRLSAESRLVCCTWNIWPVRHTPARRHILIDQRLEGDKSAAFPNSLGREKLGAHVLLPRIPKSTETFPQL